MDYLTVKEIGEQWGITGRMVSYYCEAGQINGAVKKAICSLSLSTLKNLWMGVNIKAIINERTKNNEANFNY